MYIKLQIFTERNSFNILEQKDVPSDNILCDIYGIKIMSVCSPDLLFLTENKMNFYIRGSQTSRDFTEMNYRDNKTLSKVLKALATIATVDIIWS